VANPKLLLAYHLVSDEVERSRAILDRSAALVHLDYASDSPKKYAGLIGAMAKHLLDELKGLNDRLPNDPASITRQIQFIGDFVRDLAADLRYLESAVNAKLPWSLTKPLEDLLEKYLPGKTILLRPKWRHNYSVQPDDLYNKYRDDLSDVVLPDRLDKLFLGFPSGFHIVSFPAIERKNALLHCDLAHELGHLVAVEFLSQEKTDYLIDFRPTIDELVEKEAAEGRVDPLWIPDRKAFWLRRASRIRQRALEELISDAFAIRAIGPAALFAMMAFAVASSWDLRPEESTGFYPPWRSRLRRMMVVLAQSDLLPEDHPSEGYPFSRTLNEDVRAYFAAIQEITSDRSDETTVANDPLLRLAYKSVDSAMPTVETFLETRFGTVFLKSGGLYGEVYKLVDRLVDGIPPNELYIDDKPAPASFEAIMNAGWLYRLSFLKTPFDEKTRPNRRELNRLLLKAAELAKVQSDFLKWEVMSKEA
jgi:hypothetical protein